jgi:hypothetical protein
MKLIVAGSRTIKDSNRVDAILDEHQWVDYASEFVVGRAPGVDDLAEQYADEHGIRATPFPANWRPQGPTGPVDKGAGFKRNGLMADYGDNLLAIWDGKSNGTKNMIEHMITRKKNICIIFV